MVVVVGLTDCVPPLGSKVYVLPSVPVTVTCVAFVAFTVKVDALPEIIEVGFGAMVTAEGGFGVTVKDALAVTFPPGPVAVAV
jgi:hypothetical protein